MRQLQATSIGILLSLVMASTGCDEESPPQPQAPKPLTECTPLYESFDAIDSSKWNVIDKTQPSDPGGNIFLGENAVSREGRLVMNSYYDDETDKLYGAMIESKETFLYGRFTAVMKIPREYGVVNAFFLFFGDKEDPTDNNHEIDIEFLRHADGEVKLHFTSWLYSDAVAGCQSGTDRCYHKALTLGPEFTEELHAYTIEWLPTGVGLYIDGEKMLPEAGDVFPIPYKACYLMLASWVVGEGWDSRLPSGVSELEVEEICVERYSASPCEDLVNAYKAGYIGWNYHKWVLSPFFWWFEVDLDLWNVTPDVVLNDAIFVVHGVTIDGRNWKYIDVNTWRDPRTGDVAHLSGFDGTIYLDGSLPGTPEGVWPYYYYGDLVYGEPRVTRHIVCSYPVGHGRSGTIGINSANTLACITSAAEGSIVEQIPASRCADHNAGPSMVVDVGLD